MNKNHIIITLILGILLVNPYPVIRAANATADELSDPVTLVMAMDSWNKTGLYEISTKTAGVYATIGAPKPAFTLYQGMQIQSQDILNQDGLKWLQVKFGAKNYFIPTIADGQINVMPADNVRLSSVSENTGLIKDFYGVLDQPHRYAIKLVKEEGSKGRFETYEKTADGYVFRNSYAVDYPKDGPKNIYGDLKTVGGPVVRYVYRTTNTSRGGTENGQRFGGYKISYPMPHDALPYLQSGKMNLGEYNKIPAINQKNGIFTPHPRSRLGADLVIHTDVWGSLGCIIMNNKDMAKFYLSDMVTENDKEIIPLIIYDENVNAPAEGQLF